MNGQLNQQSRLFRLPRAMLTPIGQPRRAGGVFIEQFHNILSVFFCHMHLTSYLLSCHFFFVSCQFVTKHGDCFEQLDHADTHRVNLGVARGLVLECILYLLLLCNFFFFLVIRSQQNSCCQHGSPLESVTVISQIYLATLRPRQLTQASFLQKNQMLQNVFLISVTLRWHRVACKNMSL